MAVAGSVSKAVAVAIGTRGSVGACDSKTARDNALFSCSLTARECDVLAVEEGVGGCKMASLGVVGLVWVRVTSFMGLPVPGVGVFEVIWEEMGEFSIFSIFWAKSIIFDRVSRDMVAVEGADESKMVADDVGDEIKVLSSENSLIIALVVSDIVFFLFLKSAGDCDVPMRVGQHISRC